MSLAFPLAEAAEDDGAKLGSDMELLKNTSFVTSVSSLASTTTQTENTRRHSGRRVLTNTKPVPHCPHAYELVGKNAVRFCVQCKAYNPARAS